MNINRMNILRLIIILAVAECIAFGWNASAAELQQDTLAAQMMTFLYIDIATIWAISFYPVKNLTKYIKIVLLISILTHVYGAYCWVSGIDLSVYDQFKSWIFYMELLAFASYGISGGGKRIRPLVNPTGMDDIPRVQGNSGAHNSCQRDYRG